MKKITLTLAAFAAALTMNAQTTYFSDDFNDEDVSDWALYDEDGDGNFWADIFQVSDGAGGTITPVSIISRSWQGSPLTPDNWIVSPAIDLSAEDGSTDITVSWIRQVSDAFPAETYTLYVGTSDDIVDLEASTVFLTESFTTTPSEETDTPQLKTLDITELAGEVVYLAFRHYDSNDADYLSIDDVTVIADNLAVDNTSFEGFNHYVSNNVLTLKSNTAISNAKLYNILGQEVISKKLDTQSANINLNALNSGVYLVQVQIEGKSKSFKIVKK